MVVEKNKPTRSKGVKAETRKIVLEKYNYQCAKCGYNFLEIHHVDGNPSNDSIDNLIPLCKRCHVKIHGKRYSIRLERLTQELRSTLKEKVAEDISQILRESFKNMKIEVKIQADMRSKELLENIEIKTKGWIIRSKDRYSLEITDLENLVDDLRERILESLAWKLSRKISHKVHEEIDGELRQYKN